MTEVDRAIRDAILIDTAVSPSCGLGIHIPDRLDGYYFWEHWDTASRPYRRKDDNFASILDKLVEDGRLVRMDGQLDMYVHPSAFTDEDNDVFMSEIDYLIFDEANRCYLKKLYKQYRLKYIEPEDPGMEWYAPSEVWANVIDGRFTELVLEYRYTNDWDALVVGCDRVLELAKSVGQQTHPLTRHGFDHLIASVQQRVPGRHLSSRNRDVLSPPHSSRLLQMNTVLLIAVLGVCFFGLFDVYQWTAPRWKHIEASEQISYAEQFEMCKFFNRSGEFQLEGEYVNTPSAIDMERYCTTILNESTSDWTIRPRLSSR